MKKSKGFTLIELLAVIVILAVIALIATPIIIGIIEDSKEKAYQNSAYGIIDSAKYYYTSGLLKPENATKYNENIINELSYDGEKPKDGSIVGVNQEGEVAVALKYGNNCYIKTYDESKISKGDKDNCTVDLGSSVVSNTLGSVIQGSTIVTSGSGLYKISDDEYRYRGGCDIQGTEGSYSCNGTDPVNNYISIDGQKYRIIAMDSQGVKVQTERELATDMAFDEESGNRNNANNTFCQGYDYCGVYAAIEGEYVAGNKSGTVTQNSSLYDYLNSTGTDAEVVNLRNKAKSATWNIGAVVEGSNVAISTIKSQEARNTATFKMGLINASDYIQASLDTSCQADPVSYSTNSENCRNNNWLFDPNAYYPWTINTWTTTSGNSNGVWYVFTNYGDHLDGSNADSTLGVRPVAYLDASTTVTSGTGTESDPWIIQ